MLSRRDILKLLGAAIPAAFLPPIELENEMAEFSDLLKKIAQNRPLTPNELDDLGRFGSETQQRNSFIGGNTTPGNQLNVVMPFFPIFSEVLAADVASLPIPIPGGYKHLMILLGGQTNNASYVDGIKLQLNGDTGANYLTQGIEGTGSSVTTGSNGTSSILLCDFGGGSGNASGAAGGVVFIPHYNSTLWKTVYTLSGEPQRDASNPGININCGFWKNTSGINSVLLSPVTGSLIKAGSSISVYSIL